MKTVLITGCSSGFGLETARHFLDQGWKIVATMRTAQARLLPASERLRIVALDVIREESIRDAIAAVGLLDVLVNNAGIGLLNAPEGTPMSAVREVFETSLFGTIAMTQARLLLPGRAPQTRFGENARLRMGSIPDSYNAVAQRVFAGWAQSQALVTHSADVAQAVGHAATDPSGPTRLPAGADAEAQAAAVSSRSAA